MSNTILKEESGYVGTLIHEWKPEYKNSYVITGIQVGSNSIDTRIGKLVQVRLEAGDFGSDLVLLRHVNDSLCSHANQTFWLIPSKYKPYLDECFKGVYLDDSDK